MAKTRPAKSQSDRNKKQGDRCWAGYEPTPGKKPGTKGSCKPKAKSSKSSTKSKSSKAHARHRASSK